MPILVNIKDIINYLFLPFVASVATTLLFSVLIPYISKKTSYYYRLISIAEFLKILFYVLLFFLLTTTSVYCKIELPKVANGNWRMLHLQIGESCKASAGSYSASYIAIADHI